MDYVFEGQWPLIVYVYVTVCVHVVMSLPPGTCPVLCSNNGEYEEGACRCYPGWKVSCDWWRAGHVTTVIISDWLQGCWSRGQGLPAQPQPAGGQDQGGQAAQDLLQPPRGQAGCQGGEAVNELFKIFEEGPFLGLCLVSRYS